MRTRALLPLLLFLLSQPAQANRCLLDDIAYYFETGIAKTTDVAVAAITLQKLEQEIPAGQVTFYSRSGELTTGYFMKRPDGKIYVHSNGTIDLSSSSNPAHTQIFVPVNIKELDHNFIHAGAPISGLASASMGDPIRIVSLDHVDAQGRLMGIKPDGTLLITFEGESRPLAISPRHLESINGVILDPEKAAAKSAEDERIALSRARANAAYERTMAAKAESEAKSKAVTIVDNIPMGATVRVPRPPQPPVQAFKYPEIKDATPAQIQESLNDLGVIAVNPKGEPTLVTIYTRNGDRIMGRLQLGPDKKPQVYDRTPIGPTDEPFIMVSDEYRGPQGMRSPVVYLSDLDPDFIFPGQPWDIPGSESIFPDVEYVMTGKDESIHRGRIVAIRRGGRAIDYIPSGTNNIHELEVAPIGSIRPAYPNELQAAQNAVKKRRTLKQAKQQVREEAYRRKQTELEELEQKKQQQAEENRRAREQRDLEKAPQKEPEPPQNPLFEEQLRERERQQRELALTRQQAIAKELTLHKRIEAFSAKYVSDNLVLATRLAKTDEVTILNYDGTQTQGFIIRDERHRALMQDGKLVLSDRQGGLPTHSVEISKINPDMIVGGKLHPELKKISPEKIYIVSNGKGALVKGWIVQLTRGDSIEVHPVGGGKTTTVRLDGKTFIQPTYENILSPEAWLASQAGKDATKRIPKDFTIEVRHAIMLRQWARSVIGVPTDATPAEITSKVRKLQAELHPDRNPGRNVEALFKLIGSARSELIYTEMKQER